MIRRVCIAIVLGIGFAGIAAAQTQIINDGGFEGLNAGAWQISGNGASITNGANAETGTGYLSMGNVNGANQTALPDGDISHKPHFSGLQFWLRNTDLGLVRQRRHFIRSHPGHE